MNVAACGIQSSRQTKIKPPYFVLFNMAFVSHIFKPAKPNAPDILQQHERSQTNLSIAGAHTFVTIESHHIIRYCCIGGIFRRQCFTSRHRQIIQHG